VAGGLNGILNVLLATVEPGQEVVICDPVYAGLVNRIRLAGGVPRHVRCVPDGRGWATDPDALAAAIGPQTAAVLLMSPVMPTGAGYPCIRPHGGWSLLIDTLSMGLTPEDASQRLFARSQVAATPMTGWGPSGEAYLRLVFANEPVGRLSDLGARFDAALT
jgi:aspartate/methionine/tyrosine aminotransferase